MNARRETRLTQKKAPSPRQTIESLLLGAAVHLFGALPRGAARGLGTLLGRLCFCCLGRLRGVGEQNLRMALPELPPSDRRRILQQAFEQLGRQLAEFCQMSRYSAKTTSAFIHYDGLHRYRNAVARGKGVFVLTGHLGAWELSSFFHSLMGFPMGMVIRRLDNPVIDRHVNRIRCQHGNRVLDKDEFARGLLSEMHQGRTVGILMDTNMTPPQGVFVPFFGRLACSASGLARVARKTGAAVLPGFLLEEGAGNYRLHFGEEIPVRVTNDPESDALANTATFNRVLEQYIRLYPEQWLWMHRRWKTRPPGEASLYA